MSETRTEQATCCPPPETAKSCCEPTPGPTTEASNCCPPSAKEAACCPPAAPKESCCPPKATEASCCPPATASTSCCPDRSAWERPGYKLWPFVCGWLESPVGQVPQVTPRLSREDVFGRWQMRWGMGRSRYSIAPGLYAIGRPDADSPVLVTANYKLTFDSLRSELEKLSVWILVLDTKGINVWCAAGKGTFGTDEIVRRVKTTGLEQVVRHRRLILPQLGAPGVAAHLVTKGCGFRVVYGPVRASDIPAFLIADQQATPEMRRVTFSTWERLILTPVELAMMGKISLWVLLALLLLGGIGPCGFSFDAMLQRGGSAFSAYLAGVVAGAVLTPLLLPLIPGAAFAWKGAVVGLGVALLGAFTWGAELGSSGSLALLLALPAVSSYCAMNFTGSTSYTSPSGVEYEMRRALPLQSLAVLIAGVSWFWGLFS